MEKTLPLDTLPAEIAVVMHKPTWLTCWTLAMLAFFVALLSSWSAAADFPERKKPKPKKNAAAQKEAEKQAKAAVAAAQAKAQAIAAQGAAAEGRLNFAQAKITTALQVMQRMEEEIDVVEQNLREIEVELEGKQPPNSEYAKAKAWAESSTAAYLAARERIFGTPAYKAAFQRAKNEDDPAEAMARVQRAALDTDPEYAKVAAMRDAAEIQYALLRQELFTTDETWKSASLSLRDIRQQIKETEAMLTAGGLHKAATIGGYNDLLAAAQAANAALQKSQAQLKSVQARLKKRPGKGYSSSGKR